MKSLRFEVELGWLAIWRGICGFERAETRHDPGCHCVTNETDVVPVTTGNTT